MNPRKSIAIIISNNCSISKIKPEWKPALNAMWQARTRIYGGESEELAVVVILTRIERKYWFQPARTQKKSINWSSKCKNGTIHSETNKLWQNLVYVLLTFCAAALSSYYQFLLIWIRSALKTRKKILSCVIKKSCRLFFKMKVQLFEVFSFY